MSLILYIQFLCLVPQIETVLWMVEFLKVKTYSGSYVELDIPREPGDQVSKKQKQNILSNSSISRKICQQKLKEGN